MAKNLRNSDVIGMSFTTSSGTDVKDTKMISGLAQDSLTGKNSTTPDSRNMGKSSFGKLGGLPK